MDDALTALALGRVEPKTRAGDDRLEGVDLREGALVSRVRRGPIVHVGGSRDSLREDPQQHLSGPRRTIVGSRRETKGNHPVQERGDPEDGEVAAGGLSERKIVVIRGNVSGRDEAARCHELNEVVEATHVERRCQGVRVDPRARHVDNEARLYRGHVQEEQVSVGSIQGSLVDDADTRGYASAVQIRRPEDDTHGVPYDRGTGGVRVGTRADCQRGLVLSHLLGHEAGELGCGWNGGHECRADVSIRGSQPCEMHFTIWAM